jgi:glutamate 5-kinase
LYSFKNAKRIVFKVGTSTLTHSTGLLNLRSIEQLVKVLSDVKNSGIEVVLVTSGAVGVGVGKLGLKEKPTSVPQKQACASIGQCELMYVYDKQFSTYNHTVSQILLTRDILEDDTRTTHVKNTFNTLLEMSVIPIVNENDTVSTEELEFGDNDSLSAIVACLVNADGLVVLSDIDGLYDGNPNENPEAKLIDLVDKIDDEILSFAGGAGSTRGTGGMVTKIQAAKIANESNIPMIIMNGNSPEKIYDLLDGKKVGTLFLANKKEV